MAERALQGVGDAQMGEWRESGRNGIVHIRRRLTDAERLRAGKGRRLTVRDIRGTQEEVRRLHRLLQDEPRLRAMIP